MKYKFPFLLIVLCFLISTSQANIYQPQKLSYVTPFINTHPENWKNPEISTLLKKGRILSKRSMRDYLHSLGKKAEFEGNVLLIKLDNGLKAVFKSFPDDDLGDAYAEVAAYQASVVLGFPYIPPTVMTEINGRRGSLQLFVETNIDALAPGVYKTALKEASIEDVANLKLFYFIFGQWDSGAHNLLILKDKERTYLIAIDNEGIRNHQHVLKYGSLPFVRVRYSDRLKTDDWDMPFPFNQVKTIQNPTPEKLKKVFGDLFSESFYRSFKSYGLSFRYVIFRNSLWRQYHAGQGAFERPFTLHLLAHTRRKLEELNPKLLKKIFSCAKNADFLTPDYLNAILKRRDLVLQYFDKQSNLNRKEH